MRLQEVTLSLPEELLTQICRAAERAHWRVSVILYQFVLARVHAPAERPF